MKALLTLTLLLGIIGTAVSSKAFIKTTTSKFISLVFNVPYNQAVKMGGINGYLETGNQNRLLNGEFESNNPIEGWDEASVGAWQSEAATCLSGKCLSIDTTDSAQAGELRQTTSWNSGQGNLSIRASVYIYKDALDEGEYEVCLGALCREISTVGWDHYIFPAKATASSVFYIRPTDGTFTNGKRAKLSVDIARLGLVNNTGNLGIYTEYKSEGPIQLESSGSLPSKGGVIYDEITASRNKDSLELNINYAQTSAGSNGTGIYYIKLPGGLVGDQTKLKTSGSYIAGYAGSGIVSITGGIEVPVTFSLDQVDPSRLVVQIQNNSGSNMQYSYNAWGSTMYSFGNTVLTLTGKASVPIVGWKASEEFTVYTRTIVKECQKKFLVSDSTTTGNIISFSNMIPGRVYSIQLNIAGDTGATASIVHDGVTLSNPFSGASSFGASVNSGRFTATTSTANIVQNSTTNIRGSGDGLETWAEICEENGTKLVTRF